MANSSSSASSISASRDSNNTPATHLLTLLHQYNSIHSLANAELKSFLWNITVARRGRGSYCGADFSAEDVREELRASALLECRRGEEEPHLMSDTSGEEEGDGGAKCRDDGGPSTSSSPGGGFVLHLDGMRAAAHQQRRRDDATAAASDSREEGRDSKESAGLRRRRGRDGAADPADADDGGTGTNKWTFEEPADDEEERRWRDADPLQLFGVPPPALRSAQAEARRAVAYYVEAANLAREMAEITHHR